jgi:hypothetical protein
MSHLADVQPPRPTMRRKSSAQNLLSSFKPVPVGTPAGGPLPSAPATALSFASAASSTAVTPTPGSMSKEVDAQSLYSDSLGGAGSPQLAAGTSAEYLRDLVQKRIVTLTYIRNVHEGCVYFTSINFLPFAYIEVPTFSSRSHWFHTILLSRLDLDREFNNSNPDTRRRSVLLWASLTPILTVILEHTDSRSLGCHYPMCLILINPKICFVVS